MIIKKAKKCSACGVLLQSEDPNQIGFIDKEILENEDLKILYCNECFDHKMDEIDSFFEPPVNPGFYSIINDAITSNALIFYAVDLFSFEDSFNHDLTRLLSDNKATVYIVGLKKDLFPSNHDGEHLLESLKKHLQRVGFKYKDIVLADCFTKKGTEDILDLIRRVNKGKDIYLVGARFAGKTTLITNSLKMYENNTNRTISSYNYPGTTLRVTEIPLGEKTSVFDTPGLGIENNVLSKVEKSLLRYIRPRKQIVSKTFTLHPGNSLFVGGFARLEMIKGKSMETTCYFSGDLELKKIVPTRNAEHFINLIKRRYIKPTSTNLKEMSDFDVYDIILENDNRQIDITITGLGWFTTVETGQTIRITAPRGVSIGIHDSKIKTLPHKK